MVWNRRFAMDVTAGTTKKPPQALREEQLEDVEIEQLRVAHLEKDDEKDQGLAEAGGSGWVNLKIHQMTWLTA